MPKSHTPYSPEFRRRMVERVRSGRSPESLAEEYAHGFRLALTASAPRSQ